jgi:hypothetical protein
VEAIMTAWNVIGGTALMVVGAALAIGGTFRGVAGSRARQRDLSRTLSLIHGLRVAILGLCFAGAGAGLVWSIDGLVTLAAIIALQELRETTFLIDTVAAQVRGEEAVHWFGMARNPPPMRLELPRFQIPDSRFQT